MGGGVDTFLWCLESEQTLVEVVYLACCRSSVADAMASIPYAEHPSRESLEGYRQLYEPPEDLAWSELYPELCAWLSDREIRKKRKDVDAQSTSSF